MASISRTWWGQEFIEAMQEFADPGRLQRGRSYSSDHRILKFDIKHGQVSATVRGNINPYFGVHKEPKYRVSIELTPIPSEDWPKIVQHLSSKAGSVAKLLLNEVPDGIEDSFTGLDYSLLPTGFDDFQSQCSCPDWSRPCKHIAGVCYHLSKRIDRDPFLLFELRGLDREDFRAELLKFPLGKALASELEAQYDVQPQPETSLFSRPILQTVAEQAGADTNAIAGSLDPKEFWQGATRIPKVQDSDAPAVIPGILIKKQGDYPAFWEKDKSFIKVMEELYCRVRQQTKGLF
ncbi:MAG: SWIM zinc finger family protein [Cyanobacteria bacterium J06597_1]